MRKSILYPAKVSRWDVLRDIIERGDNFHNNGRTFTGQNWFAGDVPSRGQMPEDEYRALIADHMFNSIDYVIRSYKTIIAYRAGGKWVMPEVNYSRTTSFHQTRAFTAISQLREVLNAQVDA